MKLPRLTPKKKLQKFQATARRLPRAAAAVEEDEEPNIKLSNAILVVLLLHIVAVGGIWAFTSLKARKESSFLPPAVPASTSPAVTERGPAEAVAALASSSPATIPQPSAHHDLPARKTPDPAVKPKPFNVKDSGTIYTVTKGDTPVSIARKLKVNDDDLLKLNKIDDPKKLKIGQRLHVPVKRAD